MSYESTTAVNLIAGEDLRGDVFELLKFENDAGVAKVVKTTAVTDTAIGVLGENPRSDATTDGQTVPVVLLGGVVMMKAGAAITAGNLVIPHTTAGTVSGVANSGALPVDCMAVGVALRTAAVGDIFDVLALPIAAPHSA